MSELWNYKHLRVNLIVVSFCWMCEHFSFTFIKFIMRHLGGNIFTNLYISATSEIVAKVSAIFIMMFLDLRKFLFLGFTIGSIGSLALVFQNGESPYLPLMLVKFGFS